MPFVYTKGHGIAHGTWHIAHSNDNSNTLSNTMVFCRFAIEEIINVKNLSKHFKTCYFKVRKDGRTEKG